MNLSDLPNPYDFANPVTKRGLFAGRQEELDEIDYYLDQAVKASHPINVAMIGDRASGKPSVLNMIDGQAEKLGFLTVRLNLDEGDSESQLTFFFKLFDSILTAACRKELYGGIGGRTYLTYRDMIGTYLIPSDDTFRSFIFPVQYANAMRVGNRTANVSDSAINNDMSIIANDVERPIILLFDECDVLGNNRILLEKLRNTFMNLPSFMLVLTGTSGLFPLIDGVFPPIVRQFKKISIGPFEDIGETRNCVKMPLQSIHVDPRNFINLGKARELLEIHELTGGNPYEIQLICPFMFRRVQKGRSKHMEVSLEVLDDLVRELESSQDVSARPIVDTVQSLEDQDFSDLSALTACQGSLEQLMLFDAISGRMGDRPKTQWQQSLDRFVGYGVLDTVKDVVRFKGDDFDRIYCKYYARNQKASLHVSTVPLFHALKLSLSTLIYGEGMRAPGFPFNSVERHDAFRAVQAAFRSDETDPFSGSEWVARSLFDIMIRFRDQRSLPVVFITLNCRWAELFTVLLWTDPTSFTKFPVKALKAKLSQIVSRVERNGGSMSFEIRYPRPLTLDRLTHKITNSSNEKAKESVANLCRSHAAHEYADQENIDDPMVYADLAVLVKPGTSNLNNLGYLLMAKGNTKAAREAFDRAFEFVDSSDPESALPRFNIGVIDTKEGKHKEAVTNFAEVERLLQDGDEEHRRPLCLFIPTLNDKGALEFRESRNPDLLDSATAAKHALGLLRAKRSL